MSEGVIEQGQGGATVVLLEDVTLTALFADNESEAYKVAPCTQIELILDYTMDAAETGNTANVKVLLSEDGVNYREYSIASDQAASNNVVAAILYPRRFQIVGSAGVSESRWFAVPTAAKYLKVQAQEAGIAANGGILTAKMRVSNDTTFR